MQQTLKRLKLIQTSIELDDTEIVEMQVAKLESLEIDTEVANILSHIEAMAYGKAQLAIEAYLAKYSGVVSYQDPEVQGLKLELKALEQKLQDLDALKAEHLHVIEEFNTQYSLRLGGIIEKILKRKAELLAKRVAQMQEQYETEYQAYQAQKAKADKLEEELKAFTSFDDEYDDLYEKWKKAKEAENTQRKKAKQAKEALEEDEVFQEYEETQEQYEEFHREYEEVQKQTHHELDEAEKKEIKACYRKAARLCHPDIVTKDLQAQAHEISSALNNAYAQQDLDKVKEILQMLENGVYFDLGSDTLDNSEKLKAKIATLRDKLAQTTQELESIKKDETFCIIQEIDDWESYFTQAKEALEEEYTKLLNIEETLAQKASTKEADILEEDDYWDIPF